MKSNNKQYKLSFLVTKYKSNDAWVLYNWMNTDNITIDDSDHPFYVILENIISNPYFGKFIANDSEDDFNFLCQKLFIVQNDSEVVSYIEHQYELSNNIDNLELILMPVNQRCNFDCVYCYEDHNQKDKMWRYEEDILFKLIKNQPNLRKLGIDYFGGEPLLNADFIKNFSRNIIAYCRENSIEFTSSMTTNGYLLSSSLFCELLDNGITNYQVTLDGDKHNHDKMRPLANKNGTFDQIYKNLLSISKLPKSLKFIIIIRINFNGSNSSEEAIEAFLMKLKEDFYGDDRFVINPHAVMNWKNEESAINLYLNKSDREVKDSIYRKKVAEIDLNPFNVINFSGTESNSCYAGKRNSYVVFPANCSSNKMWLPLQKCTVGLFDEINNIGYIDEYGKIRTTDNMEKWVSNSPFRKDECKSCFFVLNCYGSSCPLNTLREGFVKCPKEKYSEIEIVKEIMAYIDKSMD
jgi:uncharacterized protein